MPGGFLWGLGTLAWQELQQGARAAPQCPSVCPDRLSTWRKRLGEGSYFDTLR